LEDRSIPIDIYTHLVTTCDCAPETDAILRWAALLHDVGKPRCFRQDETGVSFVGHDRVSADLASSILERFRYPNRVRDAISHLVLHHMFGYTSAWSDAAIRRFIARVGDEHVDRLIALSRADACGKVGRVVNPPEIRELERRVSAIRAAQPPLEKRDLAVSGRDIMDQLSIAPGPVVGTILDELYDTVLDDPELNDRDRLLEIARRFYEDRLSRS
jgi:putative nucleotidyltransferase with HDIG domain